MWLIWLEVELFEHSNWLELVAMFRPLKQALSGCICKQARLLVGGG